METSYKVIYTGEVHSDFNLIKVEEGFANLFKISPEKAATFLTPNKVIKKDLTQSRANTYKRQLEKVGMLIKIECEQPEFSFSAMALDVEQSAQENNNLNTNYSNEDSFATSFNGLSVVGMEGQFSPSKPIEQSANLVQGQIECPKCLMVQDKAEQCISCGVYVQKILNQIAKTKAAEDTQIPHQQFIKQEDLDASDAFEEKEGSTSFPYIVGASIALIGAIIWNYIALTVNYEIGWVAIIIGLSIGVAVSFFNKNAKDLSVICAALALCSILGGKYLIAESEKDFAVIEMNKAFSYIPESALKSVYYQMVNESDKFLELIYDEVQFKEILMSGARSEGYNPDTVPVDAIYEYLNENFTPYFESLLLNPPGYDQWVNELPLFIEELIQSFPTFAIIKLTFDWVDWLFLFLGVSAAFQISRKHL